MQASSDFLPWYWPVLNSVSARRREQIEFVKAHFDEPILKALSFDAEAVNYLSRHAKGVLSPDKAMVMRTTFKKFFVTSCHSLPIRRERETLARIASNNDTIRGVVSRVVAAEIDRWIRRDILAPQDLLVDLPHLLPRMPFLLGDEANDLARWNAVASATEPPFGLSQGIYAKLAPARFRYDVWSGLARFWWPRLKSDRELNLMSIAGGTEWAKAAFCEDLSRFKLSDEGEDAPREFAAEFEGVLEAATCSCRGRKEVRAREPFLPCETCGFL